MPSFQGTPSRFLSKAGYPNSSYVLLALFLFGILAAPGWAQTEARVGVPLADVHRAPSSGSERVTQAFLWDRVLVLSQGKHWVKVLVPEQYRTARGYPGYMRRSQLVTGTPKELGRTLTVRKPMAPCQPVDGGAPERLFLGTRIVFLGEELEWGHTFPVAGKGFRLPNSLRASGGGATGLENRRDSRRSPLPRRNSLPLGRDVATRDRLFGFGLRRLSTLRLHFTSRRRPASSGWPSSFAQ